MIGFLLSRVAVEGRMVEQLVIFLVVAERGRGCGRCFRLEVEEELEEQGGQIQGL